MNSINSYVSVQTRNRKNELAKTNIAIQVKRAINALAMELYRPPWK